MTAMEVKNLSFAYGEKTIFSGLNARFEEGITAVMGPSGVGKTTLLYLLMGLLPSAAGEILNRPQSVSAVFQEDRLLERRSAAENILLTAPQMEEREIQKALSEFSIGQSGPVEAFSGGMKRRLALLRALLAPSQLLVMDEPFKGLDDGTKETVIARTKPFLAGRITVMVTHTEEEAEALGASIFRIA